MLAYNGELDIEKDIRYPIYASVKIDGVRLYKWKDAWHTRKDKESINPHILDELDKMDYENGVDGELYVMDMDFSDGQSIIRGNAPINPSMKVAYCEFDKITHGGYDERFVNFEHFACNVSKVSYIYPRKIQNYRIKSPEELRDLQELYSNEEGLVLRSINGIYKQGRSTLAEQYMLKLFKWEEAEATIVGFNELMINKDTSTKRKINMRGSGLLGSFIVRTEKWGTFNLSGNLTEQQRYDYHQDYSLLGKKVKFKYKPYGTKDKPRHPIFKEIV